MRILLKSLLSLYVPVTSTIKEFIITVCAIIDELLALYVSLTRSLSKSIVSTMANIYSHEMIFSL